MARFLYVYHGGKMPETEEEGRQSMAAWREWLGGMGARALDPGNPVGKSTTVTPGGVTDNGGANPSSGYTIVEAGSIDEAVEMAKGCPILSNEGTVEVAQIIEM